MHNYISVWDFLIALDINILMNTYKATVKRGKNCFCQQYYNMHDAYIDKVIVCSTPNDYSKIFFKYFIRK